MLVSRTVGPRPSIASAASAAFFSSRVWPSLFLPAEWRSAYSSDKLLGLLANASPPRSSSCAHALRVTLVLVLTPLPSLALCLLSELVLPLNDPALGWRQNSAFLLRTWLHASLISFSVDTIIEFYVPSLRLPRWRLLLMNATQGLTTSAAIVALTTATRVFPVPFTPMASTPVYAVCSWALRFACDTPSRRRDTDPRATRRAIGHVMHELNFEVLLVYLYCAFATLFTHVSDRQRPLLMLALVALKSFATRGTWHRAQALTPSGTNDFATAHVAFSALVFHALFVSVSLQKAQSRATLVVVVAFTTLYDVAMVRELARRTTRLERLATRLPPPVAEEDVTSSYTERLRQLVARQQQHTTPEAVAASVSLLSPLAWGYGSGMAAIAPAPCHDETKSLARLSTHEHDYLAAVTVLLQCREAALLRFFIDVVVPVVFFAYVAAMKFVPNGQYVPFVETQDLRTLALRLGVPLTCKLVTSVFLLRVLSQGRDASGLPSGLSQLAFALEKMVTVVQAKSLMNLLCVFDFSLLHNGNDLTFQFAWLRDRQA